jgi:hypothetical protein
MQGEGCLLGVSLGQREHRGGMQGSECLLWAVEAGGRGAVSRMPPGGRGGTEARVEEGWQAGVTLL